VNEFNSCIKCKRLILFSKYVGLITWYFHLRASYQLLEVHSCRCQVAGNTETHKMYNLSSSEKKIIKENETPLETCK